MRMTNKEYGVLLSLCISPALISMQQEVESFIQTIKKQNEVAQNFFETAEKEVRKKMPSVQVLQESAVNASKAALLAMQSLSPLLQLMDTFEDGYFKKAVMNVVNQYDPNVVVRKIIDWLVELKYGPLLLSISIQEKPKKTTQQDSQKQKYQAVIDNLRNFKLKVLESGRANLQAIAQLVNAASPSALERYRAEIASTFYSSDFYEQCMKSIEEAKAYPQANSVLLAKLSSEITTLKREMDALLVKIAQQIQKKQEQVGLKPAVSA